MTGLYQVCIRKPLPKPLYAAGWDPVPLAEKDAVTANERDDSSGIRVQG